MSVTDYGNFRLTHSLYDMDFPPPLDWLHVWANDPLDDSEVDLMGDLAFGVDEGDSVDGNSPFAVLNFIDHGILIKNEFGGLIDEIHTTPFHALDRADRDLWTTGTSGSMHRLYVTAASQPALGGYEYFHIRFVEVTMAYYGHIS